MKCLQINHQYTVGLTLILLLTFGLTWVSSGFDGVQGFGSFLAVLLLGTGILWVGLRILRSESIPCWAVWLTIGAALLRMGAGVLWSIALPLWGHDTAVQQAGYIMEDAFRRDMAAWELAQSDHPLWIAFRETEVGNFSNVDQYGGLLFLSTAVYRYISGTFHFPLMIVTLTAAFSALAIPLIWAFTRRLFDEKIAKWAAWGLAIYPEAIMLGSSQMREAFMMTLAAAAFYGLVRYRQTRSLVGFSWILGAILVSLPLSPPLAGILLGMLTIVGLSLENWQVLRNWRLWAILGGLAILVVGGIWLSWDQIAPRPSAEQFSNPVAMVIYWAAQSAQWQAKLTMASSGWVQKIFLSTPEWFDTPFLFGYGVARPLLPSALTAWSTPIWRFIGVWRALGWTLLLPILIYAPLGAFRAADKRNLVAGLSIAVWLGILIASFWGGGDQWDNPRYRVSFSSLQITLAAWMIVTQLRAPDPWMRRVLVGVLAILAWFFPWYLRRYTIFEWPVVDLFKLLGLGVASAVLFAVWDWAKESKWSKLSK